MAVLLDVLEYLREINSITMMIRIVLAALAGAIIGFEREVHGRAAGLRTHIIVSLGAALCAIIGCYLSAEMAKMGINSDSQRTGAQVISGIGFLCAGTILFKKSSSQITGLTTAAGIWSTAAIGLAIGYGIYEAAAVTIIIILLSFTLLTKIEFKMNSKRQTMIVYLEIESVDYIKEIYKNIKENFKSIDIQVTPARSGILPHVGLEAIIKIPHKGTVDRKIEKLSAIEHVVFAIQIT